MAGVIWILVLVSAWAIVPPLVDASPPTESRLPRGPISIIGNDAFVPENGVVGGTGAPSDPFRIEGWEIEANRATGILIADTEAHVLVRDVSVHSGWSTWSGGIRLADVANVRLESVSVTGNWEGIQLSEVRNASVVRSRVAGNGQSGVEVSNSLNVTIWNTTIDRNLGGGVFLVSTVNATIRNTEFVENGLSLFGDRLEHYLHTIEENLVNGLPLIYARDCEGLRIDGIPVGQVIVADCRGVRIGNLTIDSAPIQHDSIALAYIEDATVGGNWISTVEGLGISIIQSSAVRVEGNVITDASLGVTVLQSSKTNLSRNDVRSGSTAMLVWASVEVHVSANFVIGNRVGIDIPMDVHLPLPTTGSIVANTIAENGIGVDIEYGPDLTVHHNNFLNNSVQASGNKLRWDDGYPGGGNFWSDHTSPDRCRGPEQRDCSMSDGIADEPYSFGRDPVDRYPLMEFHMFEAPVFVAWAMAPPRGPAPFVVAFTARPVAGIPPYRFHFDFGDGTGNDTAFPVHTYRNVGVYIVHVTLTDSRGDSTTATLTVVVEDPVGGAVVIYAIGAGALTGTAALIALTVRRWRRKKPGSPG